MSDVNTDTGVILEALNDKADRDMNNVADGIDFVVESYQNGANWYILYKSGRIEQGGEYTATGSLTYLKPMADTNYKLTLSPHMNINAQVYWSDFAFDKTTTGCTMRNTNPNGGDWEVKGMSAQS